MLKKKKKTDINVLKEKAENQTLRYTWSELVNSTLNYRGKLLIQMECLTRETSPTPGGFWKWRVQKCMRLAQMLLSTLYDGMFLIQTIPIPNTTMEDYVKLLLNRFVKYHVDSGVSEVHIIFDHPKDMLHPKCIEHEHRDQRATPIQHTHHEFNDKNNEGTQQME